MKKIIMIIICFYTVQTFAMEPQQGVPSLKDFTLFTFQNNYPKNALEFLKIYYLLKKSTNLDLSEYAQNLSKLELNDDDLKQIEEQKLDISREFFTNKLTLLTEYTFDKKISNLCFNSCKNQFAFIESKEKLVIINFNVNPPLNRSILLEEKIEDSYEENIDFNHDETVIACAINNKVYFYDMSTLKLIKEINQKNNDITKIKFSPDGKYFITATEKVITVYDGDIKDPIDILEYDKISDFNFNKDGSKIVIGRDLRPVIICQLLEKNNSTIDIEKEYVKSIGFINDNDVCYNTSSGYFKISNNKASIIAKKDCNNFSYDSIQKIIAINKENLNVFIKDFRFIEDSITDLEIPLRSLQFSSNGNYLTTLGYHSKNISLYNVPIFRQTTENLSIEQRNFAFFCDYWQRNNRTIPEEYKNRYYGLPDTLKIKFKNILPEQKEKLIKEARLQQQYELQLLKKQKAEQKAELFHQALNPKQYMYGYYDIAGTLKITIKLRDILPNEIGKERVMRIRLD